MDLARLQLFRTAVRSGSLSAAAQELNISQPTASLQIKALEEEFGCRLLVREARGVRPTEAGLEVFELSAKVLDLVEGTKRQIRSGARPYSFRFGISKLIGSSIAPRLMAELEPGTALNNPVIDVGESHQVIWKVARGDLDLGLVTAGTNLSLLRNVRIDGAYRNPIVACGSPALGRGLSGEEALRRHPVIGAVPGSPYREWLGEELLCRGISDYRPTIEVCDIDTMKRTAMAGLGVTLLPAAAVRDEVETGALVTFPFGFDLPIVFSLVLPLAQPQIPYLHEIRRILHRHFTPGDARRLRALAHRPGPSPATGGERASRRAAD